MKMSEQNTENADGSANNISWHPHSVTRSQRWKVAGHSGAVLWFTGLSGSGKSSIANEVDHLLNARGKRTYLLDGDNVRHGLCNDLGFTAQDRTENIRRVGEVAKLMADAGIIVLIAFISPYRTDRDAVRERMGDIRFVEIHVQASLETCEARDPKGLYKKARAGLIPNFTGIDDPYEAPERPEMVLNSNSKTVQQLSEDAVQWLDQQDLLEVS